MAEPVPVRYSGGTSLVDLVDRLLDTGVVVSGDVILGLAGVDLVRIDLRLMLAPVRKLLDEVEVR